MIMPVKWLLAVLMILSPVASGQAAQDTHKWMFRVFVDDREVGYHNFTVEQDGSMRRVESRARFQVKFLFINAYEYRHKAEEVWRDGCLRRIEARTDDNGEISSVAGSREDDGFVINNDGDAETLPACIQTFAYWNLDFLESGRLLNPQTGEYADVTLTHLGPDTLTIENREVKTQAYRLLVDGRRIDLWYTRDDQQWLALEAETEGERILRYQPTSTPTLNRADDEGPEEQIDET